MMSGEHSIITQENLNLDLPVLPHTFLLAMGLSRQADHITIEEVVEVIENDPGAVARVLRVVNSAYYGLRNEVTNLHRAVVGLGPQAVLGLVMSVSLEDMKKHLHVTTSDAFNRLIRHNVAVGYLSRQMASMTSLANEKFEGEQPAKESDLVSEAFTLGLLHDFGKIVLFYNFPEEAAAFYNRVWDMDTNVQVILSEEKAIFGMDHVEAGTYLMHELNFLSSMEMAVAAHHDYMKPVEREAGEQFLLNIVVASNMLANTLGFAFNHSISRKAFMEAPLWDALIENRFFEETDKAILFKDLFDLKDRASAYVSEIA